ncbi:MAG: hypothetical protein IJ608_04395 [Lachnospiraceae bacterium]|nr:hypothetical protein [Lachnospiraceae bacterium]
MSVKQMVELFDGNVAIKFYRKWEVVFCGGKEECNPATFDEYAEIAEKAILSYGVEMDGDVPTLRIEVGE